MVYLTKIFNLWLLLGIAMFTTSRAVAAEEVSIITSNSNLWKSSAKDLTQRFPNLKWKAVDNGFNGTSPKGLLFWGEKVNSVTAKGDKKTSKLIIEIYDKSKTKSLSDSDFRTVATKWKNLLDKKSGLEGATISKMRHKEREVQYVGWKLSSATVVLAAEWERAPKSITLEIYPHEFGKQLTANLQKGLRVEEDVKKEVIVVSDNLIPEALQKQTYYLEGTTLKKKDIGGAPSYYLVYFSASWSPPSREVISEFSGYYNKSIKANSEIELVMLNADRTMSEATAWANQHKFAFPIVILNELNKRSVLYKYYTGSFPNYVVIDKSGKILAEGKKESVALINGL